MASSTPGYCTFTATARPSWVMARWTWPIDAAAIGTGSHSANSSSGPPPSSSRITPAASSGAHRRGVLLQLGERVADGLGQALVEVAGHLAELHQRALHVPQRRPPPARRCGGRRRRPAPPAARRRRTRSGPGGRHRPRPCGPRTRPTPRSGPIDRWRGSRAHRSAVGVARRRRARTATAAAVVPRSTRAVRRLMSTTMRGPGPPAPIGQPSADGGRRPVTVVKRIRPMDSRTSAVRIP